MGENLVLQVSGIPTSLYYKVVREKLLIYFLRRRNGGDGEVDVRYPTGEEGVAMLTFAREEVANQVLSRRHQLEIEGHTYPLEVSRLQCRGTQVSKPSMALSLGGLSAGEDGGLHSNIWPGYCSDGSGQTKPKDTSTEDIAANLNVHPSLLKKTFADKDREPDRNLQHSSNKNPTDSSGVARYTAFTGTQYGDDRSESRQPKDGYFSTGDKNTKHIFFHNRKPVYCPSDASQRKKVVFLDDSIAITKHTSSTIPAPPKKISADEDRRPDKNSLASNDETDSSGFAPTQFIEVLPDFRQLKDTFVADSRTSQSKPKGTIADGFTTNPNHPNSTIQDGSDFKPWQPQNTSTDEVNSNTNHSKSTIGDSTKFNSGKPKNSSTGEINVNPKLPKNGLGYNVNLKPGQPKNTSTDEFHLNPRNPGDLTSSSSNRSSLMAAGWASLSSPTSNSLTAINPKNHLDESPLSTELFVDPAAHTYVSVFMKDKISDILGPSDAEMKTEAGEGYTRVILTSKSPHLSQHFYKAAREMSDIFIKCQQLLRVQSIDLSNISTGVTKKLQSYLSNSCIWSSANEKRLQMIGPSEDIARFMEKWTSAGGDFARFVHLLQEGVSPGSSRPTTVGMDNVHQSTAHSHIVTRDVHSQRVRSVERSEEPGARGGSRGPDTTIYKTPSNKPYR